MTPNDRERPWTTTKTFNPSSPAARALRLPILGVRLPACWASLLAVVAAACAGGRCVPDEVGVAGVVVDLVGEGSSVGLAVRVAG